MRQPCLSCGALTEHGSRCEPCQDQVDAIRLARTQPEPARARASATARGYDSQWKRLSKQARRMQPFCSDCGSTDDLQADHKPEAWKRKADGKRIRLQDIDVVCGSCNRRRGAARGGNVQRAV